MTRMHVLMYMYSSSPILNGKQWSSVGTRRLPDNISNPRRPSFCDWPMTARLSYYPVRPSTMLSRSPWGFAPTPVCDCHYLVSLRKDPILL